jgi:hypothetical protein
MYSATSEPVTPRPVTPKIAAALLSAVGLSNTAAEPGSPESSIGAALLPLAGIPFVEFQINQLAKHDVRHVLLEIDSLPGALVAMADRVRQRGVVVEFIRSPSELRGRIEPGRLLFILSDGVYTDDGLLSEIVAQESPFIATLDGRDENSIFERIDLNSFWSGIAMLDANSVEAIASLPDEWSISSSLLRRALQDSVVHRPLKQDLIVSNQLSKIKTAADTDQLTKSILLAKSVQVDGVIEKFVFAPLAARFANSILRTSSRASAVDILGGLSIMTALGCAIAGFPTLAAIVAFDAIFAMQIRELLRQPGTKEQAVDLIKAASWAILAASFFAVFWNWSGPPSTKLFVATIVIGQLVLAFRVAKPGWSRLFLCSPALLAVILGLFAISGLLLTGFMLIAVGQLFALILIANWGGSAPRG